MKFSPKVHAHWTQLLIIALLFYTMSRLNTGWYEWVLVIWGTVFLMLTAVAMTLQGIVTLNEALEVEEDDDYDDEFGKSEGI